MPNEDEVLDFFGSTPRDLGLPSINIQSPELGTMCVYPVSLRGLSGGDLASMRKMKLSHRAQVIMNEQYLTPATQMISDQGQKWLKHAAQQHIGQRPEACKSKMNLQTCAALMSKAATASAYAQRTMVDRYEGGANEGIKREAVIKKEPKDEPTADIEKAGSGSDGEAYTPQKKKQRRQPSQPMIVSQPTAALGMLAAPQVVKNQWKGARGRAAGRGRASAGSKKPDLRADDCAPADEEMAPDCTLEEFQKSDPDMFEVSERHYELSGKTSMCFRSLSVQKFLEGEKLGQPLNGATRPINLAYGICVT